MSNPYILDLNSKTQNQTATNLSTFLSGDLQTSNSIFTNSLSSNSVSSSYFIGGTGYFPTLTSTSATISTLTGTNVYAGSVNASGSINGPTGTFTSLYASNETIGNSTITNLTGTNIYATNINGGIISGPTGAFKSVTANTISFPTSAYGGGLQMIAGNGVVYSTLSSSGGYSQGMSWAVPSLSFTDTANTQLSAISIYNTIASVGIGRQQTVPPNNTLAINANTNILSNSYSYQILGNNVITNNSLGPYIVSSGLTSVGTLTSLSVSGNTALSNVSSTYTTSGNCVISGNTTSNAYQLGYASLPTYTSSQIGFRTTTSINGANQALTTATYKTPFNLSLGAGVWEVFTSYNITLSGATATLFYHGASQFASALPGYANTSPRVVSAPFVYTTYTNATGLDFQLTQIIPLTTTTTIYGCVQATFSAGTITLTGASSNCVMCATRVG